MGGAVSGFRKLKSHLFFSWTSLSENNCLVVKGTRRLWMELHLPWCILLSRSKNSASNSVKAKDDGRRVCSQPASIVLFLWVTSLTDFFAIATPAEAHGYCSVWSYPTETIFICRIFNFCHSEALYQREEKIKLNSVGLFSSLPPTYFLSLTLSWSYSNSDDFSGLNIVGKQSLKLGSEQNLMRLDLHQSRYITEMSNGRNFVYV